MGRAQPARYSAGIIVPGTKKTIQKKMGKLIQRPILLSLFLFCSFSLVAQKGDEDAEMFNRAKLRDQQAIDDAVNGWWSQSMKTSDQRTAWWRDARFGMFVHWGVYSLPGGEWKGKVVSGYAEHLMRKEKIFRAEYLELAHRFNPVEFNADEWIRAARKAGMRYFIITAKHHDGFAMYPSKVSDFNISDQTPFKRDPMAELSAACKKYGGQIWILLLPCLRLGASRCPGKRLGIRQPWR
jgi:hypothetical protein